MEAHSLVVKKPMKKSFVFITSVTIPYLFIITASIIFISDSMFTGSVVV